MMQREFLELEEVIKEKCVGGPVYFLSNVGNWGDALIAFGTIKFFRQIGLEYRDLGSLSNNRVKWKFALSTFRFKWWPTILFPKGTLIFSGGGAWCDHYSREDQLRKISKRFKNIIIMPSTFALTPSIPNATFFCRDRYESKENVPEAIFCHDMALYIGRLSGEEGDRTGYFYRTDPESAKKIEIPSGNNDISCQGNHLSNIYPFFDIIDEYSVIHTDRLHVAIASCLLGKEVHLYPGSYFKNKSVYLSSLKDNFDNIYFHDESIKPIRNSERDAI